MTVRAKFWVSNINHHHVQAPGEVFATVTLAPVYDDKNAQWSKATPQGKIELSITVPEAVAQFELGKQYFVDLSPAD